MNKTITNLTQAFIGESQARNRYDFYAKIAKKEGYEQISAIFTETAEQEREHAKQLFKLINELKENSNEIIVEASIETTFSTTQENLVSAIKGENHEHVSMYPEFAKIAKEEGHPLIAVRLLSIAKAEAHHEERFKKLLTELQKESLFKKEEKVSWICRKCGYEHNGKTPLIECPSCSHPVGYFQIKCENY